MKKCLDYYRIQVKRMKYMNDIIAEDAVFLAEGDTVLAYAKKPPKVGDYMDLWFSPIVDVYERDNYVTIGRVTRVEPAKDGIGQFVVTKKGRFIVEEMNHGKLQHNAGEEVDGHTVH